MNSAQSRAFRILSVDGGGYLGLATATFIHQSERHFGIKFAECFDFFCGTSTGAIIAAALASGKTGEEIVELYRTLGPQIFSTKKSKGIFRAKYSLAKLRNCLEPHLGTITLGELKVRGKGILITAFNRTTGRPRVFKPDHSPALSTDNLLPLLDVVLASASAPGYFPSFSIHNPSTAVTEVFCDGGMACNHPALLGFSEAVFELKCAPSNIRVLSLSTPRKSLAEGTRALERLDQGLWQWKQSLVDILIDSNSDLVHETLRRLVSCFGPPEPIYRRISLSNTDGLGIDDVSESATASLIDIGSRLAADREIRNSIELFIHEHP